MVNQKKGMPGANSVEASISPKSKSVGLRRDLLIKKNEKIALPANLKASHYSKPSEYQQGVKLLTKDQKKVKNTKVNTRSCDTPNNPFVAHIVDFEDADLPKRRGT